MTTYPTPIFATEFLSGPGIYDPRAVGAKCDGVTDDTTAWQTTLAAAVSGSTAYGGSCITSPPGRSLVSAALTASVIAGASLTFRGQGVSASEIYFTGASAGFNITLGQGAGLTCTDVKLTRAYAGATANALAVTGPPSNATRAGSVHIERVYCSGSTSGTNAWANAIVLTNLFEPRVRACDIFALFPPSGLGTEGNGIVFAGTSTSAYSSDLHASDNYQAGGNAMFLIGPYVQGVNCTANTPNEVNYGVYWNGVASADESLFWNGGQIAAYVANIYASNVGWLNINNGLFLHYGTGAWTGINLQNSYLATITGCSINGNATGTEAGIVINATAAPAGGQSNTVIGNNIESVTGYAVALLGYVTETTVVGNQIIYGSGINNAANPAANNIIANSYDGANSSWNVGGNTAVGVQLNLNSAAGSGRSFFFESVGLPRFSMNCVGTETGSNVGSDFYITSWNDAGSLLQNIVKIQRSNSFTSFSGPIAVNGVTPIAQTALTGAKGGNVALANLITRLAGMGFFTDSTT